MQVANADRKPSVCPGILQFHGIDPHGTLRSLCGCLRHNGDPNACFHHAANGVKALYPGTNLQDSAEPCRLAGKVPLKCTVAWQCNKLLVEDVDQSQSSPRAAQGVSARHDDYELIVPEGKGLKGFRDRCLGRNAHVCGA